MDTINQATSSVNTTKENADSDSLWDTYQSLKAENRMLFPLEGAEKLQVSELELMLSAPFSQYLGNDCKALLHEIATFEKVESIVRNEFAVNEKIGKLENLKLGDNMGIALNVGGLDLRFFINRWQHAVAVTDTSKQSDKEPGSLSVQFYDEYGSAICKIFLRDYSAVAIERWYSMIEQYAQSDVDQAELQTNLKASLVTQSKSTPWVFKKLDDHKLSTLHEQWLSMTDVHQFHFLLKKLELDRASSYVQAPEGMAYRLKPEAIEALLTHAQSIAEPIMVFVGNNGVVQIQSGVVHHVKRMQNWINILDKKDTNFTLHLNDQALEQVWCVRRPTKDGIVTCVEGFDAYGNSIVSFFGLRQEGEAERDYWQQLTQRLIDDFGVNEPYKTAV